MPDSRRPGAQPGNTNALKHGFYASKFKPHQLDDYHRARAVTGLDEEIALLRLIILNLAETCLPVPGSPPDLAACGALEVSLARLSHLLKDQRLLAIGAADPADLIATLFASANAGLPFTEIFSIPTASELPSPQVVLNPGALNPEVVLNPGAPNPGALNPGDNEPIASELPSPQVVLNPGVLNPGRVVPNSGAGGEGVSGDNVLIAGEGPSGGENPPAAT